MPTYQIECVGCGETRPQRMNFAEYAQVKTGAKELGCPTCGGVSRVVFAPGSVTFSLREGPSGGWASKSLKENAYRAKRAEVMRKREKDHVFKGSLIPNYKGQETGSWREAQEAARSDLGDDAATTYVPQVAVEEVSR